jgi:hypothetical protein
VCLFVLCLVGAEPVLAQTQTGNINGTVEDPNGDALAGVTVTLSAGSVMGPKTDVTSASGAFRFPALLPDDDYVVTFELAGFQRVVHEGVRVSVGQTTTLAVAIQLSEVAAEITVTGETPMVDVTSITVSTNYGADLLDNIPTGRRFQNMVSQAPSMVDAGYGGGGQLWSSKGGGATSNEVGLDGVANTNPVYHSSDQEIVFEAVEEIQVVTGGLPAELGNMGGTYINVVTKSGGNEFRGQAAVYYQDDSTQSDNLTDDLRDQGLDTAPVITNFEDFSFNLGGPIKRDKVWFSVGFRNYDFGNAVSGFPFDDEVFTEFYFSKLTWQPSEKHNVYALYTRTEVEDLYSPANEFYTPEATWYAWNENEIAKAKWTAILSENAFLEADVGTSILDGHIWPQEGAGHTYYEAATVSWSGAAFIYQDNKTDRNQAKVALSWFKDDWGGSHGFKFGLEYEKSDWNGNNFKPSSPVYYHITYFGFPLYATIASYPSQTINRVEGLHLYAQDTWQVSDRVTLNLGVRANSWDGSYPAQGRDAVSYGAWAYLPAVDLEDTTLFDWNTVEPRLGATIALDDEGKSVLRIGLNRYNHGMMMGYMILGNPNSLSSTTHWWFDNPAYGGDGDGFADPNEVLYPAVTTTGITADVDPNTDNPYTDEVTIGFERELFTDFSLKLNATWRKDKDPIDLLNPEETADSFEPVDMVDPGPDGITGTADDGIVTVFNQIDNLAGRELITNVDLGEREYRGVELIATKRLSGNWQALGSIVWQESTGTVGQNFNSTKGWSTAFDDPNKLVHREGPLNLDREWQVKLSGTYLAPLGFALSGYGTYQTGTPLARLMTLTLDQGVTYIVLDPRDSHRNDDVWRLDLRVEKVFSLGSRPVELGLILDAFNVFNENGITARSTNTIEPFGRPLAIQGPRVVRLGARVRF